MKRSLLIVLDSVGIGHAPDAAEFGDAGSNTVGHIRERTDLAIPFLDQCGLMHAEALAAGDRGPESSAKMNWGTMIEQSAGKDTTTGHWELAGAPLDEAFATYSAFPDELVAELESLCGVEFIGNYAQSGTVVLEELGEQHVATGSPILYTSSDSVLQIAANEEVIPLEKLYELCKQCRTVADRERIGRVIARPFVGEVGSFKRTPNRKDFSLQPPYTILNALQEGGVDTIGIGKISDIFADSGIGKSYPTKSNQAGMEKIAELWSQPVDAPTFYFANLVDFDMLFGHRRDPEGYANCLQEFDQWWQTFLPRVDENSLVMITGDHGNDPTWKGTDHTREKVPILMNTRGQSSRCLEERDGFFDVAATLAKYHQLKDWAIGRSFI